LTVTTPLSSGSSSISIYVENGAIIANVDGGYTRSVPIDETLTLDASGSEDENVRPGTAKLNYTWTCTIQNLGASYGLPCGVFGSGVDVLTDDTIIVAANRMKSNFTYGYRVEVSSSDGRSDTATVSVTTSPSGSSLVELSTSVTTINQDQKLTLQGFITASYAVTAYWEVYFSNSVVKSLGSSTRSFSASEAIETIAFPFVKVANTFTSGRTYQFRLTSCTSQGNQLFANISSRTNPIS
jgi:hypothetical protein